MKWNDRNSIRITRKMKIQHKQREQSFDMNVSLAREEGKARFISGIYGPPGPSDQDRTPRSGTNLCLVVEIGVKSEIHDPLKFS